MKILRSAYEGIKNTIGSEPPETLGYLIGRIDDMIIQKFIFDFQAEFVSYRPNVLHLPIPNVLKICRKLLKENSGMKVLGWIHSHPHHASDLSISDVNVLRFHLEHAKPLKKIYGVIVFSAADGEFQLFPHVIHRNPKDFQTTEKLEIIED